MPSPPPDLSSLAHPTRCLPPLRSQPPSSSLFFALSHLATLYSPHSLTASELHLLSSLPSSSTASHYTHTQEWHDALDSARVDELERRYAMSWLTRLIASGAHCITDQHHHAIDADLLLDLAGRVLGGHAALQDAGAITREFRFPLEIPLIEMQESTTSLGEVQLQLRDESLPPSESRASRSNLRPDNHDHLQHHADADADADRDDTAKTAAAAVGVQTWAAAVILSDMVLRRPDLFHSHFARQPSEGKEEKMRIHELGAGTGLVGMATAKGLQNRRWNATVTMSDFHDQVLDNLRYNLSHNFNHIEAQSSQEDERVDVKVEKVDWSLLHEERLSGRSAAMSTERSHLLLLADVIYDPLHATWLKSSIETFLLRPHEELPSHHHHQNHRGATSRAHILIALRTSGKFEGLHETVEQVFGRVQPQIQQDPGGAPSKEVKLRILNITQLKKSKRLGRDDEQGYLWFEIGWVPV